MVSLAASMYGIISFLEERMRGMISKLVRISKQRVDLEKRRHKTQVTSDIQHQLEGINKIVEEEWGKRQAEEVGALQGSGVLL